MAAAVALMSSSGDASKVNKKSCRRSISSRNSATTPATRKNGGFVGTRRREWGRWAAELRMPRTRKRLWIGTFGTPKEAAHAYDGAIFCFYGDHVPRIRKLNFPTAPRPNIPEDVRAGLTVANIKAIAEKYAHSLADFVPPPRPPPTPVIPEDAAPQVVVVEEAAAAAAGVVDASIGVDAAPTADDCGYLNDMSIADCLLSFKPEDFDEIMAFASAN